MADRFGVKRAPVPVIVQNAAGAAGVGEAVGRLIIPAGFRVTLSQNAESFDEDETQIVALGEEHLRDARRVRAALGVGRIAVSQVASGIGDMHDHRGEGLHGLTAGGGTATGSATRVAPPSREVAASGRPGRRREAGRRHRRPGRPRAHRHHRLLRDLLRGIEPTGEDRDRGGSRTRSGSWARSPSVAKARTKPAGGCSTTSTSSCTSSAKKSARTTTWNGSGATRRRLEWQEPDAASSG